MKNNSSREIIEDELYCTCKQNSRGKSIILRFEFQEIIIVKFKRGFEDLTHLEFNNLAIGFLSIDEAIKHDHTCMGRVCLLFIVFVCVVSCLFALVCFSVFFVCLRLLLKVAVRMFVLFVFGNLCLFVVCACVLFVVCVCLGVL